MSRFRNFMNGRYGADQLGRFLSIVALIILILNLFIGGFIFLIIAVVLLVLQLFRMFSRDYAKRNAENQKFCAITWKIRSKFSGFFKRMKDKEHAYFKCPSCKRMLRVPKGKGNISIRCPHCGREFIKRT